MMEEIQNPCIAEFTIPFKTEREAIIAYNSLRIDKEPVRGSAVKTLRAENNNLKVHIAARDTRQLRVSVNSFLDLLHLVAQTIERFGPPVPTDTAQI